MIDADEKAILAIREAAADWVARLGGEQATATDKSAFAAWLRRSPLHVREYLRAEATWKEMSDAAHADAGDVAALLRSGDDNILEISHRSASGVPQSARRTRTGRLATLTALAATVILVLGLGLLLGPRLIERLDPNVYVTGVGEQRRVRLPDGSTVELNTRSKLQVRFSDAAREVYLAHGEVFFDVAKNASRPFRVLSDDAVVRVLGTQFNMHREQAGMRITVLEGRVAVSRSSGSSLNSPATGREGLKRTGSALLSAGDEVIVAPVRSAIRELQPLPANPRTTAWRERRLIFENETLATVITEFNRYNEQQLAVDDDQLARLRISGIFDPNEPEDLVAFLERLDDARAVTSPRRILLSPSE